MIRRRTFSYGKPVIWTAALSLALSGFVPVLPGAGSRTAHADPPPWAPAHGYRAKKGGKHRGNGGPALRVVPPPPAGLPRIELSRCNSDLIGAAIGGVVGGLAGSQIGKGTGNKVATVGGAVLGVLIGGSIGRSIDQQDQACIGRVLEQAPTGSPVAWKNPDGGQYTVTPTRSYEAANGVYCREYTTEIIVGGQRQQGVGTACRQPDGSWQAVN
jgi:surface antigen